MVSRNFLAIIEDEVDRLREILYYEKTSLFKYIYKDDLDV
jgi:hypothetical protein